MSNPRARWHGLLACVHTVWGMRELVGSVVGPRPTTSTSS